MGDEKKANKRRRTRRTWRKRRRRKRRIETKVSPRLSHSAMLSADTEA